jgi:hypothetical protein
VGVNLVQNPSFETLPPGGFNNHSLVGPYTTGKPIPSWKTTGAGGAGQFQPAVGVFNPGQLPSPTIAWSGGPTISQVVMSAGTPVTVQSGVPYVFTVDLGFRSDFSHFASSADLLLSGGPHHSQTIVATGTPPSSGNWSTFTATFVGNSSNVGDQITIQLNRPGHSSQGSFDDVHFSAVPEPGTLLLFASGLLLIGIIVYRKELYTKAENIGPIDVA